MEIVKNSSLKENISTIDGISAFGTMAEEAAADYLPLSGGTLTGKVTFAAAGREDPNIAGYTYDEYGNLTHKSSTTTDHWGIKKYDGTKTLYFYPETGNLVTLGAHRRSSGGNWISSRDNAVVVQERGTNDGGYHPCISQKTNSGEWSIGQLASEDSLRFQFSTDSNYNNNINNSTNCITFGTNGDIYMAWYSGWLSGMRTELLNGINGKIGNANNIASMQDSDTYIHVNRYSGNAKGISWWDSDKRLKGNIKDTEEKGLDIINKIEHKSFTKYKEIDKKDIQDNYKIGYIANQLQEIDPQLVFGVTQEEGIDPILNIRESVLIPYMTKAIQELSQEVEELKAKIKKLESE